MSKKTLGGVGVAKAVGNAIRMMVLLVLGIIGIGSISGVVLKLFFPHNVALFSPQGYIIVDFLAPVQQPAESFGVYATVMALGIGIICLTICGFLLRSTWHWDKSNLPGDAYPPG
jgi:uncharacterized membrane protein